MATLEAPRRRPVKFGRLAAWQVSALSQVGWVSGSFAAQQVLRLATNIALASLLAPELFGAMVIVNMLLTGGQLLTDVGISQSIINNREGDRPEFYNTAWTIQIIRGFALFAICLAITVPLARFYDNDELVAIIPAASLIFVINGFFSPSYFLLQKRSEVAGIAIFDFVLAIFTAVCNVALAYALRNIWALILGLLLSNLVYTLGTMLLLKSTRHRFRFNKAYAGQIIHFGKWMFASSIVFFVSTNFDRLYFAKAIPLALLGIYGIARTYADAVTQLMQRAAGLIFFPRISASDRRGADLVQVIAKPRAVVLACIAVALAAGIALSDALIFVFYDARYHAAALMMPILLVAAWFSTLAAMSESIVLGIGRPSFLATANLAKLIWTVATVPVALAHSGILVALVVFGAGDAVRYLVLTICKRREQLSFLRQDLACTALFVLATLAFQQIAYAAGFHTSFGEWLGLGSAALG